MMKHFALAWADYVAALELNPRLMWVYADLISIANYTGQREEIQAIYEKAVEVDPDAFKPADSYQSTLTRKWGGSDEQ